jgi:hypothetical protein
MKLIVSKKPKTAKEESSIYRYNDLTAQIPAGGKCQLNKTKCKELRIIFSKPNE